MATYRDKAIAWISETRRDFGRHISEDFPLHSSVSEMTDRELEMYSWMLYRDVRSKGKQKQEAANPDNEYIHLIPSVGSDGRVTLYDRYKGGLVASITPTSSGMPVYFGLAKYLVRLGGRGEYDTLVTRSADGDYVHDREPRKHK